MGLFYSGRYPGLPGRIVGAVVGGIFVCGCWLDGVTAVQAETLDHLYEVMVPVVDQSDKERHRALTQALDQVLVRVSGQSLTALQGNTLLPGQRQKPDDYLLEYRYEAIKEDPNARPSSRKTSAKPAPGAAPLPTAQLTARFSPQAIRGLLTRVAIPLWPRQRPAVLVWWLQEENGQYHLAPMDSLRNTAERRGLPLVLPMGDVQDKQILGALWRIEKPAIAQVAERYGIPAVLLGRAIPSPDGGWQGQWVLYFQGQLISLASVPAPSAEPPVAVSPVVAEESWLEVGVLEELEEPAVEAVVQVMLQHYGVQLGKGVNPVELRVSGATGFDAYSGILRYLQGLESINTVSLLGVDKQTLRYQLSYEGNLSALQALLDLGGLLVLDTSVAGVDGVLSYRYRQP